MKCTFLILLFFGVVSTSFAQMVSMNPFDIAPPPILDEVKALKVANPKLTPDELAEAANKLLEKEGIAFTFSFDDATCATIDKAIKSMKNPPSRLNLRTKLQSVGGEPAVLTLPPAEFNNAECTKCSVTIPILELTDNDFVALMLGRNIKFRFPANFIAAEAMLVDDKQMTSVKKKWRLPYRGTPLGVSYDDDVLYLALREPELHDLSLAIFAEGVYQFATRAEAESNGKASPVKGAPKKTTDPNINFISFANRDRKQVVMYSDPCGR